MVVSSRDGLDELTTTGGSVMFEVAGGRVERSELDAAMFGIARATLAQLQAHSLDQAVAIARAVLAGEPGAALDIVVLNAAASLHICGVCGSIAEGLPLAREAVVSARAAKVLERFVKLTQT